MLLNKLYALADSWDQEAASLLIGRDASDIDDREDISLAHYLRTCADELRQVISEVEKKNPDAPRWEIRVVQGECGDSFGECVQ